MNIFAALQILFIFIIIIIVFADIVFPLILQKEPFTILNTIKKFFTH